MRGFHSNTLYSTFVFSFEYFFCYSNYAQAHYIQLLCKKKKTSWCVFLLSIVYLFISPSIISKIQTNKQKKTTIENSSTNTINKNHQTKTNSRTTSQQFETKKKLTQQTHCWARAIEFCQNSTRKIKKRNEQHNRDEFVCFEWEKFTLCVFMFECKL